LSKPKFNQNSIELNLRLDYILTERSTTTTTPHKLSVVVVLPSTLQMFHKLSVVVVLPSTLQMFLTLNIIIASQKLIKNKWFSHHRS
jgi:hypothetical protein